MKGNRMWLLGTVAVIAIVVGLGWFLGISPKLAEADSAIAEQQSVDAANSVQEATLVALKAQYEELDVLQADVAKMQIALPDSAGVDDFVDQLQSAATATGVVIMKVTAAEAGPWGQAPLVDGIAVAPPTDPGLAAPAGASAPEGVYTLAVSVEVAGSTAQAIAFSKLVQNGPRLYLSPSFSYTPDTHTGVLNGFIFIVADPTAAAPVVEEDPAAEPTPEASETPSPDPTETPAP